MRKRKGTASNLVRKRKEVKKNSKPHANRGAEYQFVKNLKPRAKEERNIASNIVRKRREVKRTLNLVRTEG